MSRSHARNVNTASLITLCPVCLHSFQDAKKAFLRRADIRQQTRVCFKTSILPNHSPQKGKYQKENRKILPVFQAFQAQ